MRTYYEPHKFPAALLAVLVHGAFFVFLYYGITWQSQPGGMMNVELWQSLPEGGGVAAPAAPVVEETAPPPPPPPKVEEAPPPPPPPVKVEEKPPEIAVPDKKKKEKPKEKKVELKKKDEPKWAAAERVSSKPKNKWSAAENVSVPEAGAQQAAQGQADRTAVAGSKVDEYKARIRAKIRSNIVVTNVPDDAKAVFSVTVLPGGSVLPPKLVKSSGYAVYDNAVERAILKSQPLPLPKDTALYSRFRELELVFSPKDGK